MEELIHQGILRRLPSEQAFKRQSLGLTYLEGNLSRIRYSLYK